MVKHDDLVKAYGITHSVCSKLFSVCHSFNGKNWWILRQLFASSADSTPCKRSAKTRRCTSSKYHGKINQLKCSKQRWLKISSGFAFLLCKVYYTFTPNSKDLPKIECLLVAVLGLWLFSRSKSCTSSRHNLHCPRHLLRFRQCQAKKIKCFYVLSCIMFEYLSISHLQNQKNSLFRHSSWHHHLTTSQLVVSFCFTTCFCWVSWKDVENVDEVISSELVWNLRWSWRNSGLGTTSHTKDGVWQWNKEPFLWLKMIQMISNIYTTYTIIMKSTSHLSLTKWFGWFKSKIKCL